MGPHDLGWTHLFIGVGVSVLILACLAICAAVIVRTGDDDWTG
jgi:hypothetical protein